MKRMTRTKKIIRKAVPRRQEKNWSNYQEQVFKHIREGNGHSSVIAAPGSGKTTTIVESLYHIPRNESILALAFNKSIADELMLRTPPGTSAYTFHRLGLDTVKENWGRTYNLKGRGSIDQDDTGIHMLASRFVGVSDKSQQLRESIVWAVKMAKTMLANTVQEIELTCVEFGIPACGISNQDFSEIVFKILEETKREPMIVNGQRCISFDDMLWLPHVHGWEPRKFDRVFVDEAQDLSASRISLATKALGSCGRLCVVFDPKQAIYTFAGAIPGITDDLVQEYNTTNLPLSVSYRCPKAAVALAKEINPSIEAAPNAIDGNINHINQEDLYKHIVPGKSAVLSRNNFVLISTAFELIKNGIKASVIGKDIGQRFLWRINNWMPTDINDLTKSVNSWREEYISLNIKNKDRVNDEADSILKFVNTSQNVQGVKNNIQDFFSESNDDIVKLSTTHKAKGLEWDNVFVLSKTYKPDKSEEDQNIYYVTLTRTKQNMTFVN